jgi:rhodanese-related sulfurtransferase
MKVRFSVPSRNAPAGRIRPMRNVSAEELLRRIQEGDSLVVVDALPPMAYAHSHLPGAINLPPSSIDPDIVARRIPDRLAEIVVYCANPDCEDSLATAQRLQRLGYTNVSHYAGGKNEWRDAGFPLERAGKPFVPR